jgi:hypothetical protein
VLRWRFMRPGHWGYTLCAVVLLGAFLLHGFLASRTKSATFDETGDIAAGLSYLETGRFLANPQHPPLLKELAALSLYFAGVRLPDGPPVQRMLSGGGGEREAGGAVLTAYGADRVMFFARLPFLVLAALLGSVLYVWACRLFGALPAVCALFLYTLDPTVLAHSYLATMDAGLAAFAMLFLFALWHYVDKPDGRKLVFCGLVLGCLLATKFSALLLLPVAAILVVAATPRKPASAAGAFAAMCVIASVVIQVLYWSTGGLYLYAEGLQRVNADHHPDYLVFLGGQLAHHFAGYFAIAWLVKEPLAIVILTLVGLAVLRTFEPSRAVWLFLLLPPAVLFAAHSLWADDLGIRYLMPVLPFAHIAGGAGAAWLLTNRARWGRPLAAGLAVWTIVAALGVSPDHLSYFNEAACLPARVGMIGFDGGTRCGPLWLDDSNVDWGQGLKQLKTWLDRHGDGQPVRLADNSSAPPGVYGLVCQRIGIEDLMRDPDAGRYVVSAHLVARVPVLGDRLQPGGGDWIRRQPSAIVGHALYIFDIGSDPKKRVRGP